MLVAMCIIHLKKVKIEILRSVKRTDNDLEYHEGSQVGDMWMNLRSLWGYNHHSLIRYEGKDYRNQNEFQCYGLRNSVNYNAIYWFGEV